MAAPRTVRRVSPGSFEPARCFYPRVPNAQVHPLVRHLLRLGNERITARYCHMHPEAARSAVEAALGDRPRWFHWGGADLFICTTPQGVRRTVVIETNSCPSGQKSMPTVDDPHEHAGYRTLLERSFLPLAKKRGLPKGDLAVLTDKNPMEAEGYACTLADLTGEDVWIIPFHADDPDPPARFTDDRVLEVRTRQGQWQPIRAALRYVTQRPWDRIPPLTKTLLFNPVLVCLAGGRNKLIAAKAYDLHNAELAETGLRIRSPETIWDVSVTEVPLWIERMGGVGVVKNPYSNAGQGVWTITNAEELQAFMALEHRYDRFVVQALIGNSEWSSRSSSGRLFHIGTVPDKRGDIYAADLRFMVGSGPGGFFPVAIYARQARAPLARSLEGAGPSWEMLGTNLSVRAPDGRWDTETERLLLVDQRDFNRLGVGLDDLIEGYLQAVMSVTAIDRMAARLVSTKGRFRPRLFGSLNPDPTLLAEICS